MSSSEEDEDFVPDPEEYNDEADLDVPAELLVAPPPPKPKLVYVLTFALFRFSHAGSHFLEKPVHFPPDYYSDLHVPCNLPALMEKTPTLPKLVQDFGAFQSRTDFCPALRQWVGKYSTSSYEKVVAAHQSHLTALQQRLAFPGLPETEKASLEPQIAQRQTELAKAIRQRDTHLKNSRVKPRSAESIHRDRIDRVEAQRPPFRELLRVQREREEEESSRGRGRRRQRQRQRQRQRRTGSLLGKRSRSETETGTETGTGTGTVTSLSLARLRQSTSLQPPPSKRLRTTKRGLDRVLATLEPPSESAVQRSRNDWEVFKVTEDIAEEVEFAARDGLLEKRDFLDRVEVREFEQSRDMRNEDRRIRQLKGGKKKKF